MAKPLTVKAIENLHPGPARREIPDGAVPGLYLVVQPNGKTSWAYRYRIHGRPRKLTFGSSPGIDLRTARELARDAYRGVVTGVDPGAEKKATKAAALHPANDLVEAVVARFISQYAKRQLKPATAREVSRILAKEVVKPWRGRRLSQIGRTDIHELLDAVVDRGAPVSANRIFAWLRRMCAWAIERGLIDANPCAGIRAPAAETARDRTLGDEELASVWKAAGGLGEPYGAFVKLLILTGARRSEVAGLCWKEISFDAKLWTLPKERSKNGIEHTIPLSDQAISILKSVARIGDAGFVFTISGRRPISGFHSVKRRLDALIPPGIDSWVLHDLRRSFASGCARLNVAIHVVEKLLGHMTGTFSGIVAVYQKHDYATEQRTAVETWARHVERLVSGETSANVVELRHG